MDKAKELSEIALGAAENKKANNPVLLDLKGLTLITDFFLIVDGSSHRQVQAIADEIKEQLSEEGNTPLRMEGYSDARWILLDYGEIIIHIFLTERRSYYDLERLWGDAKVVHSEQ